MRLAGAARPEPGAPSFFHYWALAADTGAFAEQRNFARTGGASDDADRALAKAIGEAVERYCAAVYTEGGAAAANGRPGRVPRRRPRDLRAQLGGAVRRAEGFPARLPSAAGRRCAGRRPPTRSRARRGTCPRRWSTSRTTSTPARGEHADRPADLDRGSRVTPPSTKRPQAALSEVVERDAFTIVWQARIAPPGRRGHATRRRWRGSTAASPRRGSTSPSSTSLSTTASRPSSPCHATPRPSARPSWWRQARASIRNAPREARSKSSRIRASTARRSCVSSPGSPPVTPAGPWSIPRPTSTTGATRQTQPESTSCSPTNGVDRLRRARGRGHRQRRRRSA